MIFNYSVQTIRRGTLFQEEFHRKWISVQLYLVFHDQLNQYMKYMKTHKQYVMTNSLFGYLVEIPSLAITLSMQIQYHFFCNTHFLYIMNVLLFLIKRTVEHNKKQVVVLIIPSWPQCLSQTSKLKRKLEWQTWSFRCRCFSPRLCAAHVLSCAALQPACTRGVQLTKANVCVCVYTYECVIVSSCLNSVWKTIMFDLALKTVWASCVVLWLMCCIVEATAMCFVLNCQSVYYWVTTLAIHFWNMRFHP